MKSVFETIVIVFVSLVMVMAMVFFVDEVVAQQECVQVRNQIIDIVDVNGGYTAAAKAQVDEVIATSSEPVTVSVSKTGVLAYGEKIEIKVELVHKRIIPMLGIDEDVLYSAKGMYYNTQF